MLIEIMKQELKLLKKYVYNSDYFLSNWFVEQTDIV